MKLWALFKDRSYVRLSVFMAALQAAIFIAEAITARDPDRLRVVTDLASIITALLAAALYAWSYQHMLRGNLSTSVWGWAGVGVGLWAVAEMIWGYYELVLGIETPYPGAADAFWIAGYIPLYVATLLRYRSLRGVSSGASALVFAFAAVYGAAVVLFVVAPIMQSFDSSRLLESVTNLAYPIGDYGLCLLALTIIFALERGRFATPWRLFGTGLVFAGLADALFSYASWNDLYYPAGQASLLSLSIDGGFNISYLLLGAAVFAYVRSAGAASSAMTRLTLKPRQGLTALIMVNPQGRILSISDNFADLRGGGLARDYSGSDLAVVLGLEPAAAQALIQETVQQGSIVARQLPLLRFDGDITPTWLTSVRLHQPDQDLDLVAFILRGAAMDGARARPLSEQQAAIVDSNLRNLGALNAEDEASFRGFLLDVLNLLFSIIEQFSGRPAAHRLLQHLNAQARQNGWPFTASDYVLSVPDDLRGDQLEHFVLPLLHAAEAYASDITDSMTVRQEMRLFERGLNLDLRNLLSQHGFDAAAPGVRA